METLIANRKRRALVGSSLSIYFSVFGANEIYALYSLLFYLYNKNVIALCYFLSFEFEKCHCLLCLEFLVIFHCKSPIHPFNTCKSVGV